MRSRAGSSDASAAAASGSPPHSAAAPRPEPPGQPGEPGSGLLSRPWAEAVHVHAGRAQPCALGQPRLVQHLPEALGRVPRAHQHALGPAHALEGVWPEALAVRAHRVLQRAAVDLDRVGNVVSQRPREDRRPHDEVVGERHVGPRALDHVAHGADVRLDVALHARVVELGVGHGLVALVAVRHVDRQHPADVGHGHVDGLGQVELLPAPLLAHQLHLVPQARERAYEARVVDVAARPAQQVAVKDQDPQGLLAIVPRRASPPEVPTPRPLRP